MITTDLQGIWTLVLDEEKKYTNPPQGCDHIKLPDSTAHAKKGAENRIPNLGYMTDRYYFEGYAWYSRTLQIEKEWTDKRITLFLERTRISTVYIDGEEISTLNSLCSYHRHDLTGKLTQGEHMLTIRVDNTDYPTRGGHMTSPDTQTNWNGIVGRMELQIRNNIYPDNLQIYAKNPKAVQLSAEMHGLDSGNAQVTIRRKNGEVLYQKSHFYEDGILCATVALEGENLLWDAYHTNLLSAEVSIEGEAVVSDFGIRSLTAADRKLFINDKELFLRGKHDGLVFPETGYAPMTVPEWRRVFGIAKEYGINHYRFHTCCPPDAAFTAADEMGIYLEPELPFWGTIAAEGEEYYNAEEQNYLVEEGFRILREYGNHPSFIILSMGNELWGSMERINRILYAYKQTDSRHLYTQGSNNFQFCPAVLPDEDIFCGVRFDKNRLFRGSYAMCDAPQGHIQTMEPNSSYNYDAMIVPDVPAKAQEETEELEIQFGTGTKKVKAVENMGVLIPHVPVISHEVGQYSFFPDFSELGRYEGSQQPLYLEVYRERMEKSGLYEQWKDFFHAAGAFATDCYRREIEAALLTRELSGFQLLDLQDFPGQNVALVGILNAWLDSKHLITPKKWREFCNDTVILAKLERFVVKEKEEIHMPIVLSVCNWEDFAGKEINYQITQDEKVIMKGCIPVKKETARLQEAGEVIFTIPSLQEPCRILITLQVTDTEYRNTYTLWAYPDYDVEISEDKISCGAEEIYLAKSLVEAATYRELQKKFIYIPEQTQKDVEGTYCTDFWNYPMFRSISESMNRKVPVGTLGLYIHENKQLEMYFPTERYSTPQWYHLVMHSHCKVLTGNDKTELLVQPIDNVERCEKLGMLYYENDMLVCTSRLWEIREYPEVKAFAKALTRLAK